MKRLLGCDGTRVLYSSEVWYATVFVKSFTTDCPGLPYGPLDDDAPNR